MDLEQISQTASASQHSASIDSNLIENQNNINMTEIDASSKMITSSLERTKSVLNVKQQ
jgi:hypothetical protein